MVKFRLQNQIGGKYKGIVGSFRNIIKDDGVKGLFRGLSPTVKVYTIDRAIWFPLYFYLKAELAKISNVSVSNTWVHINACIYSSAM
jgi:hypothetical protein